MHEIIKKFPEEIVFKSQKIRAIVIKVEGVLTSSMVPFNDGSYMFTYNLLDDNIVKPLRENGIILIATTHIKSSIVKNKIEELSYDDFIDLNLQKTNLLNRISTDFGILPEEICYVGYDMMDLPFIKQSGLSICPNDSVEYIKSYVDFTARAKGGEGVLREIADLVLSSQNKLDKIVSQYVNE